MRTQINRKNAKIAKAKDEKKRVIKNAVQADTTSLSILIARMLEILKILKREYYSDAHCSLFFNSPYELLVATILSAQCTDDRVNKVSPILFQKYPDALTMAKATQKQIEKLIQSTGFYKSKALSILSTSQTLSEKYDGIVPKTLDELTAFRGVGRKTANVVLGNAFGIPGLVVDTHVGRLCRRMEFTSEMDPEKVEFKMMKIVPRKDWILFSHLLIAHGRATCQARKPKCETCVIARFCPSREVLGNVSPNEFKF